MSISPNILEPVIGPSFEQILSELEKIYPPTQFNPDDSMEKIMYRSGQRSVVEWIIDYLEEN